MGAADYRRAKAKARALRGLYSHVATYALVNVILIVINLLTSPDQLWFYWVTIFWGVGLFFHFIDVFTLQGRYLDKEWEDRQVKRIMEEDKKKKAG
jgi:hypothetical protein